MPVEGHLDVAYDQAAGTVELGSSSFATPATRVEVSGTLGKMLQVRLRSTDLNDLLPALAMAEENPPTEIPLKLRNGSVTADGSVTGPLDNPRFTGQVTVSNGEIQGHGFDQFTGEIDATRMEISGTRLAASRGAMTASGSARLSAREGSFEDAGVTGQLELRNAPVGELAREAGSTVGSGDGLGQRSSGWIHPAAGGGTGARYPAAGGVRRADRPRARRRPLPARRAGYRQRDRHGRNLPAAIQRELPASGEQSEIGRRELRRDRTERDRVADRTCRQNLSGGGRPIGRTGERNRHGSRTEVSSSRPPPRTSPGRASRWMGNPLAISP